MEEFIMEQLQGQAMQTLQIVLGAVISILGALVIVYLKKGFAYLTTKTTLIQDEGSRKILDSTLNTLDTLLVTNITSAENTLKPIILQDIADGKVTTDELESLKITVMNNTLKQLGKDATKLLNNSLGDTNSYLENRIEAILADLKIDETSSVSKTVIGETSIVADKSVNNVSIDKVTVNSNDAQELLNGIVDIANQTTTLQ